MTEKGRQGNSRRCARWRSKHRQKYRAYKREYMRKYRGVSARVATE